MIVRGRPRAVLLGRITTMPFGGVLWQVLHYLIGLERLGFETYYVEAHAEAPRHFMDRAGGDGAAEAAEYLERVLGRFGFTGRWAFHALHADGRSYGMSESRLRDLYASAELLINLHGGTVLQPDQAAAQRVVCVATDPVQMELELYKGVPATIEFFQSHDVVFSFGENYGHPDCLLPITPGFPILPTRQPVVLELWDRLEVPKRRPFTTVANWSQRRDLQYGGEIYEWSKHLEFLKVLDLPQRTPQPFELALSRCPEEHRKLLEQHGWRVRDAVELSRDLDSYRNYIGSSRAEFTVAKDQNVRLRSGWFSDRSATYLASGRPVVTQDTGFGNVLPTGDGLFAFSTVDDAVAAVEEIDTSYERHRRAARDLARWYFAHDVVLGELLEAAEVEIPRSRPRSVAEGALRVTLVSHRFPPDAVGGVERYTENLAESLAASGHSVSAVARRGGGGPLRREVEQLPSGVVVHRLTGGSFERERFLEEKGDRQRAFRDALVEAGPDVVHVNHVLDLSPGILKVARDRGAAVVLTLHDYYFACPRIILRTTAGEVCAGPESGRACATNCYATGSSLSSQAWPLRTLYFRRLLSLPDRIVCPSRFVAEFFTGFGAPEERLRVVPNGVWIDREEPTDDGWSTPGERGRLSVAFLGAALPHKGLMTVIDALEEAQLEAVDLTAFGPLGDGELAREAYHRAEGIPGLRFRMFGEYEPHELPLLLRDVDCVVVPSQWPETFCLVAWEALARGIPVVVSRLGALPDGVVDGVNGFAFDHDRPDRLAAILLRLATEHDLVSRLRRGARETRVPTLSEHVAAIEEVYREALEQATRDPGPMPGEMDELSVLEEALEAIGFGDPDAVLEQPEPIAEPGRSPQPAITAEASWN